MAGSDKRIEVVVNGEPRTLATEPTALELLRQLDIDPRTVAVEHNGEIVRRQNLGRVRVRNGDRLEIVHFVQGGRS